MVHIRKKVASKTLTRPYDLRPDMGCDPEFFFKKDGQVIGAEKVIPKGGWNNSGYAGRFIIDGVQAELNPRPNTCRALLGNEISACFKALETKLKEQGQGVKADFSQAVEISKEALAELDEKSRLFGCAPSKTIYRGRTGLQINKVDPKEYRIRAAGGHIHIGVSEHHSGLTNALKVDYKRTVVMLDLLCGNSSVLIDRNPANIERRKVYGKAGEFRLPKHGLEYRTLSNYWLHSAPLFSFAFGMARMAVQLMASNEKEDYYEAFAGAVTPKKLRDAINNNDFDLAAENFNRIETMLLDVSDNAPIHRQNIENFYYFVKTVKANGLAHWFPEDPMTHWTKIGDCHGHGFRDFLYRDVKPIVAKINAAKTEHENQVKFEKSMDGLIAQIAGAPQAILQV